jgi:hypothetical protein
VPRRDRLDVVDPAEDLEFHQIQVVARSGVGGRSPERLGD